MSQQEHDPRLDVLTHYIAPTWQSASTADGPHPVAERLLAAMDEADQADGWTRIPPPVDTPAKDLRPGDMVWHGLGSCRTVQQVTLGDPGASVDVLYADGTRQLVAPWLLMSVSRPVS